MDHFFSFLNVPSATDTASVFMKTIFRLHGLPDNIISDQGTQLTSKFWISIFNALNIKMKFSTPFHHQINGLTDRVNSVVGQYLRCFTNYKGSDRNNYLYLAEFSYNDNIQESSNFSPFFANYGFNPKHSPKIPNNIDVPIDEEYITNLNELSKNLEKLWKMQEINKKVFSNKPRIEP